MKTKAIKYLVKDGTYETTLLGTFLAVVRVIDHPNSTKIAHETGIDNYYFVNKNPLTWIVRPVYELTVRGINLWETLACTGASTRKH